MSKLQEKIEESRKNWVGWAKKRCEGVNSPTITNEYKQIAQNNHVSDMVKLIKEGFVVELNKEK